MNRTKIGIFQISDENKCGQSFLVPRFPVSSNRSSDIFLSRPWLWRVTLNLELDRFEFSLRLELCWFDQSGVSIDASLSFLHVGTQPGQKRVATSAAKKADQPTQTTSESLFRKR